MVMREYATYPSAGFASNGGLALALMQRANALARAD